MKNKKRIIIGVITFGLVFALVALVYHSRQGLAVPVISHYKEGTITGKHFLGATAVYISPIPAASEKIHSLINALFTTPNDTTIVINDGQPEIPPADGDDFNLYVVNATGVVSKPFEVHFATTTNMSLYGTTTPDIYDIALYGTATSTVRGMSDTDSALLLENDGVIPAYLDFMNNDLQKMCPFYKPDGVTYRDCLVSLLTEREKGAERMYSDIVQDTQIINNEIVAEDQVDGSLYTESRKSFLADLAALHKTWKPYRDALCDTELSSATGGSNSGGYLDTCKLYQTTVYETRLLDFRYQHISYFIQLFTEQNTTPKLDDFKKLIQRDQQIMGQ